jgi:hypothetical protein
VKKYLQLTLTKVSYVTAVVDTDLEGAELESAYLTPEKHKDAEVPWFAFLKDRYYDEYDATSYELDDVSEIRDPDEYDKEVAVRFLVEPVPECEDAEGGA